MRSEKAFQLLQRNKLQSIKLSKSDKFKENKFKFISSLKIDPFIAHFFTPITLSNLTSVYLANASAYSLRLSTFQRGAWLGFSHAYAFLGIFSLTGPQRNSLFNNEIGILSILGLLLLVLVGLIAYKSQTKNLENKVFETKNSFSSGFILGCLIGSGTAYLGMQLRVFS